MKISSRELCIGLLIVLFAVLFSAEASVGMILPSFFVYFLIFLLPGFLLSFKFDGLTGLERFLVGFPISLLFFIVVQFLSFIGVPISVPLIFVISFILPVLLSLSKKDKIVGFFKQKIKYSYFVPVLIILIFTVLVWMPALNTDRLPLTAATGYYVQALTFEQGIVERGSIPLWDQNQDIGWPQFTFDPLGYYYMLGVGDFFTPWASLNANYNFLFVFGLVLMGLGFYSLSKRFGFSNYVSLLPAFFAIAHPYVPRFALATGYTKTVTALVMLPVVLNLFYIAYKKDSKYYLLIAPVLASMFFIHTQPALQAGMLLALSFVLMKLWDRKISVKEVKYLVVSGVVFLFLVAFWAVPMFSNMDFLSPSRTYPEIDIVSYFSVFAKEPRLDMDPHVGIFFLIACLAGLGTAFYKKKNRVEFSSITLAHFLIPFFFILPVLGEFITKINDYEKYVFVQIFSLVILLPALVNFKDMKKYVAGILLLILLANFVYVTNWRAEQWYSERGQNGIYVEGMEFLRTQPGPGRVMEYGTFGGAAGQFISQFSGRPNIGAAQPLSQHNDYFIVKTYSEGDRTPPKDRSTTYVMNLLRQAFTRYIFIDMCGIGGIPAYEQIKDTGLVPVFQSQNKCEVVLEQQGISFASKVKVADIRLSEIELYDKADAWKVIGFWENQETAEYVFDASTDVASVPEPEAVVFGRPHSEKIVLKGDFNGEWIFIAESYFPRWVASMNGRPLEVKMSNLGFILVKSGQGKEIVLENKPFSYEVGLSLLAVLALLGFFGAEYINLKKWSKKQ